MPGTLYIGTSSWSQKEWGKKFFPKDLPQRRYLEYLSGQFPTVEVNASFYRNQPASTYKKWYGETPDDFIFAIKVSRYITHIRRLKTVRMNWKRFATPTNALQQKRGPFLMQFPSFFKFSEDRLKRIDDFLAKAMADNKDYRFAFEFRNDTWFVDETTQVLKKHDAAYVVANSTKYPTAPETPTSKRFIYFRLHGPKKMFASGYTKNDLKKWAKVMRKCLKQNIDVYAYFNNDMHAYAPANAQLLKDLLKRR